MLKSVATIALSIAAILLPALSAAAVESELPEQKPLIAYEARIAGDDARTRIVIDFDRKPTFRLHYTARPNRLIVDLDETVFGFGEQNLAAIGLYSDIRYGTMGEGVSRIVLTAHRPIKAVVAEVRPNETDKGFRLVIESEVVPEKQFADLVQNQQWKGAEQVAPGKNDRVGVQIGPVKPDEFIIAVDAGHGGIDAGARGTTTKVEEKTVTLSFAQALVERLNKEKGVRAFLTREDDTFVSLSERVVIARQHQARLLISLHADTLRQKDIRGATVYTISDKASDKLAESLAERENLSDRIAGLEIKDEPEEITDILIDLTRRETQAFSIQLAEKLVKSFEGQIELINNPLRHAGFRVLQAPDVPSILLELGFLSNPKDEKLLTDPDWQKKIADLIAQAVDRYLDTAGVARGG
ncbi:N-acetylmuramoyl-L-alanine amidase [Rhizobium sp. KVB221]|uniref:N-acetylmuramoyl-L-alanine amidase n=1 Tax=Rhizobium setariae TaxID=2801340 RepID=A0A936YQF4_9HYPH|nr:N-acetylmuramoyl-L-alanine amidase [Rhizobium setariae]MBL0374803.1 N-acetylmuramoyl-L-alanine amidase [Rhizobium setariae]